MEDDFFMENAIEQIQPQLPVNFQAEFTILKAVEEKKDVQDAEKQGTWIVEGFASTGDLDAQEHRITAEAQQEGAASLAEYNTLLYNHDPDKPIGKILKAEAQEDRLFIKTFISHSEPIIWQKVQDGTLSKFSIKGQILDSGTEKDEKSGLEITVIKSMKLFEVSLVSVPANVKAKSLAWYIEKALTDAKAVSGKKPVRSAEKEITDPTADNLNACIANRSAVLIEAGMSKEAALVQAKKDCMDTHKANDNKEDTTKAGHRDGDSDDSMTDCVSGKAKKFREQGMDASTARKRALAECQKIKNDANEADEATLDKLCAEYPWLVDVIDKVEAKLKNEGGVQEDMSTITKNASEGLQSAITTLEGIDELEGEAKEQVASVVRSLNALLTGTSDEGAGEGAGEDAAKAGTTDEGTKIETSAAEDLTQLMKVFEEKMDENLKLMREALEKVEASAKETKEASVTVASAKDTIEKKAKEVNEVVEKLPIRKAAGPELEDAKDDRTGRQLEKNAKERVIEKVGEKEYDNAKPGQQLQWLLEERALLAGGN